MLTRALQARFGDDPGAFGVPARVASGPLFESDPGCHKGALLTLHLQSPLAILPGDRVAMCVVDEAGKAHTRIYSVGRVMARYGRVLGQLPSALVVSFELSVRRTGGVRAASCLGYYALGQRKRLLCGLSVRRTFGCVVTKMTRS